MAARLTRWALQYGLLVAAIVGGNFWLAHSVPGSSMDLLVGSDGGTSTPLSVSDRQALAHAYGLDVPLGEQWVRYLQHLVHGDLGRSTYFRQPVAAVLWPYLLRTAALMGWGLAVALVVAFALSLRWAKERGSARETRLLTLLLGTHALPPYVTAMVLLLVFSVWLPWLPAGGASTPLPGLSLWEVWTDRLRHLLLPVTAYALWETGALYFFLRNIFAVVLNEDFIITARAKGVPEAGIMWRHVLRAAWPPLFARLGVQVGQGLAGVYFVERVFSYPGIATLSLTALGAYDYPLLQGIFLVLMLAVVGINALADLAVLWLDPRVGGAAP